MGDYNGDACIYPQVGVCLVAISIVTGVHRLGKIHHSDKNQGVLSAVKVMRCKFQPIKSPHYIDSEGF
jgi:hypothetical protein